MSDKDFIQELTDYLAQFSEGHTPVVPLLYNRDAIVDREKTLAQACFAEFKEHK